MIRRFLLALLVPDRALRCPHGWQAREPRGGGPALDRQLRGPRVLP